MSNNADEWQVAGGGKRNRRRRGGGPHTPRSSKKVADIVASEANGTFNGNRNPQLSVSDIAANHDRITRSWRESLSAIRLQWLFSQNVASHAPIDTAVCLGLGSFDPGEEQSKWQRTAHIQLEAFLVILKALEKHSGKKIKCYAQEPFYVSNDKEYLKTLDIETIETPDAFNHVTSRAFVYGMHLPHKVWNEVLRDDLPGLCVGICLTSLEDTIDTRPELKDVLQNIKRIRGMAGSYDKFDFPETDGDYTFHGSDIFWRKKDDDGDAATKSGGLGSGGETEVETGGSEDRKEGS